ncbi:hypothetical protein BU072_01525 [Mammaliicoccus vitulinus]|uniref:Uncharacterized protein n=1 Tax=Mammaliicoccus vitulinus TaxID=71237 RepID=A0A2T4PWV6_9STAP|nr:hypothetical protein [Mammaliicoccus vitulinus]PTI30986.1 hypothetical protein BU072_01525 [Mammaliicoccus vitulinus]
MIGSILIAIAMFCLMISVIIGLSEFIKVLMEDRYKFKCKSLLLFFGLYILFLVPGLIFVNI